MARFPSRLVRGAAIVMVAALPVAGTAALILGLLPGSPGAQAADVAPPDPGTLGSVTHLPVPRFVSMRAESANARRGPSLDQRVDWEFLRRGLPLEITAEYGQWRRVRDADGMGGWVHHTLLSGVRTALVRGADPVALRAGPDDAAVTRALVEPGVVARLDSCAGPWCEIVADGTRGWLPRATIWGVGPDENLN